MCKTKNFYLWVLQVVLLSGLLAFVLWLSLRPQNPIYTIVEFNFDPILSSAVQNTSSNSTSTISFSLEVENPNKDSSIYYDNINVTVYYESDSIGGTDVIPSFYQDKSESHQFKQFIHAEGQLLDKVFRAVSNRTAEFRVGLVTSIRFKTSGLKSKHHGMELQGRVKVGSDGKISGKKNKIRLRKSLKTRRLADFLRGS
ncbi:Late embryogenesis abundant protein [Macleaya cordata]|uniref:Late embryogenesis abundant protein n=1 Tax=Macleaya cordata TaxID=56857 RepID=A0A200QL55_MACCD|nr:Late embryogenesis abundant protein [Macleaya cordata]